MILMILDILSWICLLTGSFLGISGAVGLFRFPDFFTRIHASGVTDTMCTVLIIGGLMLQAESWQMLAKLLMILLLLTYTSPTSAHSLAKSAIRGGLRPTLGSGD